MTLTYRGQTVQQRHAAVTMTKPALTYRGQAVAERKGAAAKAVVHHALTYRGTTYRK
jgi:hypothetical protein